MSQVKILQSWPPRGPCGLPSFSSPPHFPSISFLPCSTQLQCLLEASRFHAHLHRTDVQAMQTPVTKLGWGVELRAGCPPMPPDSPLLSSGFSLAQCKPCTPPEPGRATPIATGEPNPIQIRNTLSGRTEPPVLAHLRAKSQPAQTTPQGLGK